MVTEDVRILSADTMSPEEARRLADAAAFGHARAMPELSAHVVITRAQAVGLAATAAVPILAGIAWPHETWRIASVVLALTFMAGIAFRALLALISGGRSAPAEVARGDDTALPVYTILVPLLHEANVLPRLARALLMLDYPADKLDIKLIVEEDDFETAAMTRELTRRGPFEAIVVPAGEPRTKPRACNYAFNFARGEMTVIYDAEDRPERDQLRKAVATFRASGGEVACLQARLNFYNALENWLTRLFALDYALWFDVMLPGLDRLGVPMPLGGTSNHFRSDALRRLGGWDPFNVTEDADLGIRIAQCGMKVAMLDSTTFEEAPARLGVWVRQRSRWMKGYMQTWLVHTRRPLALKRRAGWSGFFAFHLFVGGAVLASLAVPVLWGLFALSLLFKDGSATIAGSGLAGGNLLLTLLAMGAPLKRGWSDLAPYGLTVAVYWSLIAFAAWRGLRELVRRPFHWEKTAHGLSRFA